MSVMSLTVVCDVSPKPVVDCALRLRTVQQEEGVGREQRQRADGAVREVKALREEVKRLKDARTVSTLGYSAIVCVYCRTL